MIEPWLMHTEPRVLRSFGAARDERPTRVVVDWERRGKYERQAGSQGLIGLDTTIRPDDDDAVAQVRSLGFDEVVCRIDPVGPHSSAQIASVRAQGGIAVLVPMWHTLAEVDAVLQMADGLEVGVMVETTGAIEACHSLAGLGVTFAFVGLVDLAIERATRSIFAPIVDGTLEHIAAQLDGVPFGFGGLTLPHAGNPIPNRLLVGEMARLGASFSFLRRSFLADVEGTDTSVAVRSIRAAATAAHHRTPLQVAAQHGELVRIVRGLLHGD